VRLVYRQTQEPVRIDDTVTLHDGRTVIVKGMEKPHHSGSTGRVLVVHEGDQEPMRYYPSVIEAEWIEREDQTP